MAILSYLEISFKHIYFLFWKNELTKYHHEELVAGCSNYNDSIVFKTFTFILNIFWM